MASTDDSRKRKRLLNDASSGIKCLSDLPNGVLTHAASYLVPPSRALFAVALSTKQNAAAASSERNISIVGNEWNTLDFGDIEIDLAEKLSDEDISAVLLSIDAVNKLKRLKLTNCLRITGKCLEPLRRSTMIEQIDLSLVTKHQRPDLFPIPPITCDVVVPILDSIIEREGCSLVHLQFPYAWQKEGRNGQFYRFLERYGAMLLNRNDVSCPRCNESLPFYHDEGWISTTRGNQNYTCCECLKYYCDECYTGENFTEYAYNYCQSCERNLCADCQSMVVCDGSCESFFCVECIYLTECSGAGCRYKICENCTANGYRNDMCWTCSRYFCHCGGCELTICCNSCGDHCCIDCNDLSCCDGCSIYYCSRCNETCLNAIKSCENCESPRYCGKCRASKLGRPTDCTECLKIASPFLAEEIQKVRGEIAQVKAENEELKAEIKALKEQLKA